MTDTIATPYGRKTPDLLCRAMDALEREPQHLARIAELEAALRELVTEADATGGNRRTVSRYAVDKGRAALAKGRQ